jgi:SAM-dependent methyltransferase
MNTPLPAGPGINDWATVAGNDDAVERLLRERTDVFCEARRVLHIAPQAELQGTLSALEHLDYHCSEQPAVEIDELEIPHVSAGFDVIVCDGELGGDAPLRPLREIARLLRPGGRAILSAPAQVHPGDFAKLIARAGFFVSRRRELGRPDVFLCVRGEQ